MYNFDSYNVLLAIIAVLLMTAFVLQGHILLHLWLRMHSEIITQYYEENAISCVPSLNA